MTRKNKDLLKKLGVISPMDELREQMAALANPAHLLRMQEQVAAMTNPSHLLQMREQVAAMSNPSRLLQMQEQVAAMSNPSHLLQMREQVAAMSNPSRLLQMQEQMAAMTNPSRLLQLREQMAALANPSHLLQMREQVAALASGSRMQAELSAALSSYQGLMEKSALARFLVTPDSEGKSPAQVVQVEGFDSLAFGDHAVLQVDQVRSIDLEIVKAISDGDVAELSPSAAQHLQSIYLQIVVYWDMLLRIFNTCMAVVYLTALMSSTTTPADIHKQAAQLSNYERQLLTDYRIVNRNGARLRAEPSKKAEVIVSLQLGLPVEVLENNGKGWFRVLAEYQDESVEGWIHLTVTTPVPPPKRSRGLVAEVDPA